MDPAYKKALSRFKTLSHEEAVELHRRMHDGDRSARDRLIESVLKLVYRIATDRASSRNSAEELAAEGNVHAMRAVDAWEPEKGKLSTIVAFYVTNGIKSYLWQSGHAGIYIPLQTAKAIRRPAASDSSRPDRRRRELERARAASYIVPFSSLPPKEGDKEFDVEDDREYAEPVGFCLADMEQLLRHNATRLERQAFAMKYTSGEKVSHATVGKQLGMSADECRSMLRSLIKRLNRQCKCKFCGGRFVKSSHAKRYCSARCYRLSLVSPGQRARCKRCGSEFLSHQGAKYCSRACVRRSRAARLHELYEARKTSQASLCV